MVLSHFGLGGSGVDLWGLFSLVNAGFGLF